MTENTSSADGVQAATSGLPQAGTPTTTDGQAPVSQTSPTDHISEHERIVAELRKENAANRKKLSAYEETERQQAEAKKLADEAQLSEIERVKKQHTETEQQVQRYKQQFINTSVKLAAKDKGIIDPELAAMAITSSLEYDKDGMPTNVEEALDALIKNKPYLAPKPADPPATPAQSAPPARVATPALPAMNPGRTQITPPGSNLPPGRITLADIHNRRK